MSERTLTAFFNEHLQTVDGEPRESISWAQGITDAIDQDTYDERLDILPPRWISGRMFAFGEGSGPFSIFWQQQDRYFVRHLSDEQTEEFCRLARVRLHQ